MRFTPCYNAKEQAHAALLEAAKALCGAVDALEGTPMELRLGLPLSEKLKKMRAAINAAEPVEET